MLPSKEEWEQTVETLSKLTRMMCHLTVIIENLQGSREHFPDSMTIKIAARYMGCPIGRIKNMIYKQGLLKTFHIDLTSAVYVSKEELDRLKYKAQALRSKSEK